MVTSNILPTYVKRMINVFLISLILYFPTSLAYAGDPPDDIRNKLSKVVIDAGHGGRDPGALGKHYKEKDIALAIALKTGKYIEENIEGVEVIYTRKKDEFVELYKRAEIANKNKADLFISIHVNANNNSSPYGTSSHILGLHRTEEHFHVAVRENSVILLEDDYETRYEGFDPKSLESYILFSVMQDTYLKQSMEFASYTQNQFRDRAKRKDRGVIQQGLLVLAQTSMPAVLIETGFISNPTEEQFLASENGQDLIASAIYRSFKKYKNRIEENSQFSTEQQAEATLTAESPNQLKRNEIKNTTNENEIAFHVQIVSSRNLVETDPASFKGYQNVKALKQGIWYKYLVGRTDSYENALNYCSKVKDDYPGAFVIAVRNGEIISLKEAILEINK